MNKMNMHGDDFRPEEGERFTSSNPIIPRERVSKKKACIIALGVVFYTTTILGAILVMLGAITLKRW